MRERRNPGWTVALALACALALGGCTRGLTGLSDAEVRLQASEPLREPPALLAQRISYRLAARSIPADVKVHDSGAVVVVAEEAAAPRVASLLTWPGGLELRQERPDVRLTAPAGSDLAGEDGRLVGSWDEVHAALPRLREQAGPGSDVVAERAGRGRWSPRAVSSSPLAAIGPWTTKGPARATETGDVVVAIAEDQRPLLGQRLHGKGGPDSVVVVRGDESLGVYRTDDLWRGGALVLRPAEGPDALLVAREAAALLNSGYLPPLTLATIAPQSPRWGLAGLNLGLPFLLAWIFLAFVRRFDRAHPEPLALTAAAFALGGLSTIPTLVAEMALTRIPWLHPEIASRGGRPDAFLATLLAFTIAVGLVEEGFKFAAARLVTLRREFDEPIDGIVYGVAASLGFAAVENVSYLAAGRVGLDALTGRTFIAMPVHLFLGGLWGYALGARLVRPERRVLPWVLAAALVHGFYNAAVSTRGLQAAGILVSVALAVAFTFAVRRLLRHGLRAPGRLAVPTGRVQVMRLGSPLRFWTCAVVMYVTAMFLTAWGMMLHETRGDVPGASWVAGFLALAILPLAAYGATTFLPLDAVLDDEGFSFAGAFRPWSSITGAEEETVEGDGGRAAWIALVVLVGLGWLCILPLIVMTRLVIAGIASARGQRPVDRSTAAWLLGTPQWILVRSSRGNLMAGPVDGHEGEILRHAVRDRLAARASPAS